ncbi:MAG: universal stress protein, partial [Opitutales bacterium]
ARIRASLEREGLKVQAHELFGPPALRIHEEALRVGADCIVIGSHGHGALYDILIGSIAIQILKQAPCPVLVVPAERRKRVPDWIPEAAATVRPAPSSAAATLAFPTP